MDTFNLTSPRTRRHASGCLFFPAIGNTLPNMTQIPSPIALLGLWIVGFVAIVILVFVVSKIIYDLKREIQELRQARQQDAKNSQAERESDKLEIEEKLEACREDLTAKMDQCREEDLKEKLTVIRSIEDIVGKLEGCPMLKKDIAKNALVGMRMTADLKRYLRRGQDGAEDADESDLSSDTRIERGSVTENILGDYERGWDVDEGVRKRLSRRYRESTEF